MNTETIKQQLFEMTISESKYKNHTNDDSLFYSKISKTFIDDKEIYVFKFDQQIKDKPNPYTFNPQLKIVKHSRYSVIPIHIHDYVEMNYIYSGSCSAIIQEKEIVLNQGDICIMDTNVPHTIINAEKDDIIINFLMKKSYFNASMLSRLSSNSIMSDFLLEAISKSQKHNRYILFHCQESTKLPYFVENLLCDYYDPSFSSKDTINAYMVLVFSELLHYYQKNQQEKHNGNSLNDARKILEYIEENYMSCTLESAAEHFSFHPNYLSRYIPKHTGKTFKQLVQEQRLNKAVFLLLNTDLTIEEIIGEVGYQNYGFFNKIFKERYSLTPNNYRKKLKESREF